MIKKIFSPVDLLDLLLGAIIFFLGLSFAFPSQHIITSDSLFKLAGGSRVWGYFFILVGGCQMWRVTSLFKYNSYIKEILNHSINFCLSLSALSLLLLYPFSQHTTTYLILSAVSFYRITRFDCKCFEALVKKRLNM